jgi:tripartite-type tricarboxylate transporter receptor subunit TctC
MADNNFVDTLIKIGVDPITKSSPEHAAAMIKSEIAKWKPLIEKLNLRR